MEKEAEVSKPARIRQARWLLKQGMRAGAHSALCNIMSSDRAHSVLTDWVRDMTDARERREQRDRNFKLRSMGARI